MYAHTINFIFILDILGLKTYLKTEAHSFLSFKTHSDVCDFDKGDSNPFFPKDVYYHLLKHFTILQLLNILFHNTESFDL